MQVVVAVPVIAQLRLEVRELAVMVQTAVLEPHQLPPLLPIEVLVEEGAIPPEQQGQVALAWLLFVTQINTQMLPARQDLQRI